jgi:hypothetical protein
MGPGRALDAPENHIGKNALHNDLIASSKIILNQNRFVIIDLRFPSVVSGDTSTR